MIADVVRLTGGLVGVVGERLNGSPVRWRVYFRENSLDVPQGEIAATLSEPTYEVGDTVTVWPDHGQITAIDGDVFTVEAVRSAEIERDEFVAWTASLAVPRWRIIRDNDTRIDGTATP